MGLCLYIYIFLRHLHKCFSFFFLFSDNQCILFPPLSLTLSLFFISLWHFLHLCICLCFSLCSIQSFLFLILNMALLLCSFVHYFSLISPLSMLKWIHRKTHFCLFLCLHFCHLDFSFFCELLSCDFVAFCIWKVWHEAGLLLSSFVQNSQSNFHVNAFCHAVTLTKL